MDAGGQQESALLLNKKTSTQSFHLNGERSKMELRDISWTAVDTGDDKGGIK